MSDNYSDVLDDLLKQLKAIGAEPPPPVADMSKFDNAAPYTGMEVEQDGVWVAADRATWRSWTGRRMLLGREHHGPVFATGSGEDAKPWQGKRLCVCQVCQQHVAVPFRYN